MNGLCINYLEISLRGTLKKKVFETKVLRQALGHKRDENREWRKLENEEIHILYHFPQIFRLIKSRSLRWTEHIARIGEGMNSFKIVTDKSTSRKF